jgi:hypothetical protein
MDASISVEPMDEGRATDLTDTYSNEPAGLPVVSDLLLLLADTREQLEKARADRDEAQIRADRALASSEVLTAEIQGMTATVTALDAQLDVTLNALAGAEARIQGLEALSSAVEGAESKDSPTVEIASTPLREKGQVRGGSGWRITAALRSITRGPSGRRDIDRPPNPEHL